MEEQIFVNMQTNCQTSKLVGSVAELLKKRHALWKCMEKIMMSSKITVNMGHGKEQGDH